MDVYGKQSTAAAVAPPLGPDLEHRLDVLDRRLAGGELTGGEPRTAPQPLAAVTRLPEPREPGDGPKDDQADQSEDRLAAMERRLRRLEQLAWGSGAADLTELDVTDPELVTLAKAAEQAQTLSRMLVTPRLRAACDQTIEVCRQWQQRYDYARDTAVAASLTIATTRADQDRHREAAQVFEAARAELAVLLPRRRRTLNTAHNARQQLAHDREVREHYGHEIAEGHRSWATLTTRLRIRTSAAVERGEPLPNWLVESLGVPPSASAAGWRELATQLLAYRLTYAVIDPVQPLGEEPGTQDSSRRRQWHRDLGRQLSAWRSGCPGSI
ncbi:MAG TPA: hypothetical protein VH008_12270 [Pseudonocardia sp.]|nr:hypothetical protein [Pseudonocardia sp.]